jgi:chromosome segregation ATPase
MVRCDWCKGLEERAASADFREAELRKEIERLRKELRGMTDNFDRTANAFNGSAAEVKLWRDRHDNLAGRNTQLLVKIASLKATIAAHEAAMAEMRKLATGN